MPSIINSRDEIKKYDLHNVFGSVEAFPDQLSDAWTKAATIKIPDSYKNIQNIVISGMGGSALGGHVIKHLFKEELSIPLEIHSTYQLPSYVGKNSLVILSSYSGTTEETLAAGEQALSKGAKILAISTGAKLIEFAKAHQIPYYQIDPIYNPSQQPRMAVGYSIIGQLVMLNKLGLLKIAATTIQNIVKSLKNQGKTLSPEVLNNPAKYLAFAAFDKTIILSASEHLVGAAHVVNNQLNENSKTMTAEWHIPELNHHYMEALSFPTSHENYFFLFFNSPLYYERNSKRIHLTKQLADSKGFASEVIQATAATKLEQVFEIIALGGYFNFYLAMLHKIDPAPIPSVDWFKAEMAK